MADQQTCSACGGAVDPSRIHDCPALEPPALPFSIQLKSEADSRSPREIVSYLPRLARRLGLTLQVEINDVPLFVVPSDSPDDVDARWRREFDKMNAATKARGDDGAPARVTFATAWQAYLEGRKVYYRAVSEKGSVSEWMAITKTTMLDVAMLLALPGQPGFEFSLDAPRGTRIAEIAAEVLRQTGWPARDRALTWAEGLGERVVGSFMARLRYLTAESSNEHVRDLVESILERVDQEFRIKGRVRS